MDTLTSVTLLEALRNPTDRAAWERFAARYQPMVLAFALKLGLSESDAQDAAQETMLAFVDAYLAGTYSHAQGRLRSWLFGVAYRKVCDIQRRAKRQPLIIDRSDATGFLGSIESPETAESLWDQEWQQAVLRACLAEARQSFDPVTLQAFESYALDGRAAEQVAQTLGISRNAVYIAKNRVLSRLRELRRQMEQVW